MLWFGIVKPCSFPAEGRARQPLQTFLNEATHREEAYFFSGNIAGTILAILAPLNQQALSSLPALATFFDLSPATTTRKWLRGGFVGRRARGSMGEALACCKPGQNSHCWTRIEFCQFSGLSRTMSFVPAFCFCLVPQELWPPCLWCCVCQGSYPSDTIVGEAFYFPSVPVSP